ncbi:MAG: DUF3179 domain-containing protein [Fluviicola sp.]|nr:DUF3179 domain-containing protein [Fluviicola sp.]
MKTLFVGLISVLFFACSTVKNTSESTKKQRPLAHLGGKFFVQDGKKMMYGGKDSTQHFNIGNSSLINEQFHYGIGREAFPALLKPEFITVSEADAIWPDSARFLLAYSGDDIKAYSVKDLTRHEVVNDELNGHPIMAAYCILADLGAVYDRQYGAEVLTFALSGYTYFDKDVWNGLDGFVLWDRETESLWWPLIGKSFSGPLKEVKLQELDRNQWKDTTWGEIKKSYPAAKILKSGQDFERPTDWREIENVTPIIDNFK